MILKRFYEDSLAHASYLVGCPGAGEAIIIDPNRNVGQYVEAARMEGLRITGVTETHIHADYVSGTRELSEITGATMYLSGAGGSDWQYTFPDMSRAKPLKQGDQFKIGVVRFDVLHTPGHTPEHLTFLVTDEAASPEPLLAFTGDFVFVGDVGRPDLLESAAGVSGATEPSARNLYRSLAMFKEYPEYLAIWPGHGAGSACGKSLGGVPVTTLGYESRSNWAFKAGSEDGFVEEVLAGQPDPAPYFARMKKVNREGPKLMKDRKLPQLSRSDIKDALVLDVRPSGQYLQSHPKGALHVPFDSSFLRWTGWLVDGEQEIVLAAPSAEVAARAAMKLALIGIDNLKGWTLPAGLLPAVATKTAAASAVLADPKLQILDVRHKYEWDEGHIAGAINAPLPRLEAQASDLPRVPLAVHCSAGGRTPIAISILERAGFEDLTAIANDYEEIEAIAKTVAAPA